jgi:NitT/TauT family transport system substrate-binding protein
MKTLVRSFLSFLVCLALLPGVAVAQEKLQTVTLGQAGDGFHLMTLHIANRGGFFEKEGLKLDWVDLASGPRSTAAVMSGSADFTSISILEAIQAASRGGNLIAFCAGFSAYPMTLVLSKEAAAKAGITKSQSVDEKVKRLKGLTIAISSPGASTDALIRSLLLHRGMNPDKDIVIQPIGNGTAMYAAFKKKVIDGFVWVAPLPQLAEEEGLGIIAVDPLDGDVKELNEVPYSVLATSHETLQGKPDLIKRITRAVTRAIKLVHTNPEEARKLVRMSFPKVDEKAFNESFDEYARNVPKTPVISEAQVANTVKWRKVTDPTLGNVSFNKVVFPDFSQAAAKDLLSEK